MLREEIRVWGFDRSVNWETSEGFLARRRDWFSDRVWFWIGTRRLVSIRVLSWATVMLGFSIVSRSRPSLLLILIIILTENSSI